jgi:hypothetical protein
VLQSSFLSRSPCGEPGCFASLRRRFKLQHTRGYGTGHPATYFALHRTGFFVPPTSPLARWALTPPFHYDRPALSEPSEVRLLVFCDTVRRHALTRAARACGEACAASCPAVSGLSSPNFYPARVSPHLGIKELRATTKPQSWRERTRAPGSHKVKTETVVETGNSPRPESGNRVPETRQRPRKTAHVRQLNGAGGIGVRVLH